LADVIWEEDMKRGKRKKGEILKKKEEKGRKKMTIVVKRIK
jgi:hypothetical protein